MGMLSKKSDIGMATKIKELTAAFLSLKTQEEMAAFLKDICTPNEISALAERWQVAGLLAENKYTYREISQMTGASTTTVGRVARFLFSENNKGYWVVLNRLQQEKKE